MNKNMKYDKVKGKNIKIECEEKETVGRKHEKK